MALAEASFGGVGARIALPASGAPEIQLFHEAPSRILVSTNNAAAVVETAKKHNVEVVDLGVTINGRVVVDKLIDATIEELHEPWSTSLEKRLHA